MSDPLLVFAMKEESQDVFEGYNVLHTGIGKVNAVHGLMKYLSENPKPSLIVNMGTAGSRKHAGGSIVNATSFVQRDMDVTALGIDRYVTPFSSDPAIIEYGQKLSGMVQGVCGTGDNFDASDAANDFDVVDMEAFALALICKREKIPFLCLKYVSDGADGNAHQDWSVALHRAAEALRQALKEAKL